MQYKRGLRNSIVELKRASGLRAGAFHSGYQLLLGFLLAASIQAHASPARPFQDKPSVVEHVHAERAASFKRWDGPNVPIGSYDPNYFERKRIGTFLIAPTLKVHLDAIRDTVNFPSFFELIDASSGALLAKFSVRDLPDAEWYFPGTGFIYLNQTHLGLCGPRYTRKFQHVAGTLAELQQPLNYIGEEANVVETATLYQSPVSKDVVAVLPKGSKAQVLGVVPGEKDEREAALLVKTPLGLTGWHRRGGNPDEGRLDLYLCN